MNKIDLCFTNNKKICRKFVVTLTDFIIMNFQRKYCVIVVDAAHPFKNSHLLETLMSVIIFPLYKYPLTSNACSYVTVNLTVVVRLAGVLHHTGVLTAVISTELGSGAARVSCTFFR